MSNGNLFSLNELLQHGENGYQFQTGQELADQLQNWFENFPKNESQQAEAAKFHEKLETFQKLRWDENWEVNVSSLFA